jgi:MFS transporter, DHA2 family, multidrug resistance protein
MSASAVDLPASGTPARAAGDHVDRAGAREWVGLGVLALPTLLVSMDLTVLHTALPTISEALRPSSSQLLWIVDIYGFLVAGLLITMGTLGDRLGRRRVLLTGAAAFGVASMIAAFSANAGMLIGMRAALGLTGATLLPSTLALIRHMFVDERQRAVAFGIWVAVFSAGTAIGPVAGGALLVHFWWGSVFLLAVPAMAALLIAGPRILPEVRDPDADRLDPVSVAMSIASVLLVIYGLKLTAESGVGWSAGASVAIGLAAGALFLRRQQRLATPLINLGLFRSRAFSASLSAEAVAVFVWSGSYLFIVQYLQLVVGLTPLRAGVYLLPAGAGSIVGGMVAPVLANRIRPGSVVAGGLAVAAAGLAILTSVEPATSYGVAVLAGALAAAGASVVISVGTDLIVGAAPPEHAGAAAGIAETGTELGLALGVAIIGSVGTAVYRSDIADATPAGTPSAVAEAARETLGGALEAAQTLSGSAGDALAAGAKDAFTHGLQVAAGFSAVIALTAAALAFVFLRRLGREPAASAEPTTPAPSALRSAWAPGHCASTATRSIDWINRRMEMSLHSYEVRPSIAVSDIARAVNFYERRLGLSGATDSQDDSRVYACGGGTSLHVYESPANAGKATATQATWRVADLDQVVDELASAGVTFEQYHDDQLQTDERGIHTLAGGGKVAWFKDPDGNTFAIEQ